MLRLSRRRRQKSDGMRIFDKRMQKKLAVLFICILVAFLGLNIRLYAINRDNGEQYKKNVLSQQQYDSIVLPAKRGEIVDTNGTKIAVSQKVYNICIDAKTLSSEQGAYLEPTISALYATPIEFNYTQDELRGYIAANPGSQYRVIAKKQPYDNVSTLMEMLNNPSDYPNINGVWLEDTYQRTYPYGSLACDVIGFVQGSDEGAYGLEEYYNNLLKGTNGREYGYLNDDENLERTVKPAEDGKTLVTSIDVNIQSIVEKHILAFNEEHKNEAREGNGSKNTGVIVMNPNTGEVVAMASYPVFDLNNPRDDSNLVIELPEEEEEEGEGEEPEDSSQEKQEEKQEEMQEESVTEEDELIEDEGETDPDKPNASELAGNADYMNNSGKNNQQSEAQVVEEIDPYEAAKMEALNALWKNFCINSTYEPGSTMKPFTMAAGLEEGILTGNESYNCNGSMEVGDHLIHCNNRLGHGPLDFSGALENSCNVAFMKIGATIGKTQFMKYNQIFNFGLKTNIDLTGEALTNSLVFDVNHMTPTDLAVGSFGQGFNVTMIQMAAGFCSLINGGYYYQPHLVTKILNSDGATVETIEPRVLKQTISQETSEKMRELCRNVVELGTGKSARPAGYMIGGKTGTAEKLPRKNGNYVVSFIGYAPADNPQLVIYTVIDEPNVEVQASAKYATVLTRDILTEVLPYMNVFQTEELSEEEAKELAEKQLNFSAGSTLEEETVSENAVITIEGEKDDKQETAPEEEQEERKIVIDPETGYAIDPTNGVLLDPNTGRPIDGNVSDLE